MIRLGRVPAVLIAATVLTACAEVPSDTGGVVRSPSPAAAGASVVPWVAIGVPDQGPVLPEALLSGDVSVDVISDGNAQPGDRFHFIVRISNASAAPIPLAPCPSYRVGLQKVVEVGTLNCAGGPNALPANGHVDYAMEVGIDPDVKAMSDAPLVWQLGGEPTDQIAPTSRVVIAWT